MKKVVYNSYGTPEVLQVVDSPVPTPAKGQVLVKIMAAGVNPIDFKIRRGDMKMIVPGKFPRTPGGDIAGEVVENGPGCSRFKKGDKIFAMLTMSGGGYSEYLCVKEEFLSAMPKNVNFTDAASVPLVALTALQSIRKKDLKKGSKVLINGASGGVGMFGVQIAKNLGAETTAVTSAKNIDFVKSLGADKVIDYTKEDFTKSDEKYDLIFDAVATRNPAECWPVMEKGGVYVSTLPVPAIMIRQALNPLRTKKVYGVLAKPGYKDLDIIAQWIAEGMLKTSVEKTFTLQESSDANAYIETGRVRGKIVIVMPHNEEK